VRYRTLNAQRGRRRGADDDEWMERSTLPTTIEVHEELIPTGLLDELGRPIYREPGPVGFRGRDDQED